MITRRIVGVFTVLFFIQLLRPFQLNSVQNEEYARDFHAGYYNNRDRISWNFPLSNVNEGLSGSGEYVNKTLNGTVANEDFIYAPLLIGAGHGTTGTHLFVSATCELGFVSLHYGIGCIPKHVLNITAQNTNESNSKQSVPIQFLPSYQHYRELLQRHQRISVGLLKAFRNNQTNPLELREQILHDLEGIITWGKVYKVALALHDTPYPMLLPEILTLVEKHYGRGIKSKIKPIIILSERDPEEYVKRRTQSHGSYTWVCRPSSSTIEKINPQTFEGGAFDLVSCINDGYVWLSHNLTRMDQIFYTMNQAKKMEQIRFVVDSFENYQSTVRNEAIFSYNVFNREIKTSTRELAAMLRKSLAGSLLDENRLTEGAHFTGFEAFISESVDSETPPSGNNNSVNKMDLVDIHVFKNEALIA
jgi:hypothetical protein